MRLPNPRPEATSQFPGPNFHHPPRLPPYAKGIAKALSKYWRKPPPEPTFTRAIATCRGNPPSRRIGLYEHHNKANKGTNCRGKCRFLNYMNAELVKQALAVVVNPNILINMVSQRVRQLNSGGGGSSRPLIPDAGNLSAANIALQEIVDGKMGYEAPEIVPSTRPSTKNRKRPANWAKS